MADAIRIAASSEDYREFAQLIREYVDWCRQRYVHEPWFIEATFDHQSLDAELERLHVSFGPPNGKAVLSLRDGMVSGGVAYRRLSDNICEMKRLYVRDQFHGGGIGKKLCNALVNEARSEGFSLMRLDTANLFDEAIALYRSIGFDHCPPYNSYPDKIMPYIVFMEKRLG